MKQLGPGKLSSGGTKMLSALGGASASTTPKSAKGKGKKGEPSWRKDKEKQKEKEKKKAEKKEEKKRQKKAGESGGQEASESNQEMASASASKPTASEAQASDTSSSLTSSDGSSSEGGESVSESITITVMEEIEKKSVASDGMSEVSTESEDNGEDEFAELDAHYRPYFSVLFPIVQIFIFHISNSNENIENGPMAFPTCGDDPKYCTALVNNLSQNWWRDNSCEQDLTQGVRGFDPVTRRAILVHGGCPNWTDQRGQWYRVWGYSICHVSFTHVWFNAFFELMLGPSLEMQHGHERFIPLVFLAVMGGALAVGVCDPAGRTVGSSGYVWGLVPMHMSGLILNWNELGFTKVFGIRENWFRFWGIVVISLAMAYSMADDMEKGTGVSHAAHAGGAIYGFFFSLNFVKNVHKETWETVMQYISLLIAAFYTVFCIYW
eukprot:CAMPEP_0178994258 /NCGR_PEP_ID=MMETSP0795-20121207/7171_1 /TAXON_ID=88552 /ORGANISM="Amoebophrya sp., Strain Ameob2" /LENGTH=436 /DNA_ID=CAMNT_0020686433 /DNA_START=484 /DNA_END=1791 /DNA_ORIENTATION=-